MTLERVGRRIQKFHDTLRILMQTRRRHNEADAILEMYFHRSHVGNELLAPVGQGGLLGSTLLQAELSDAREALEAATAWNKILLVQLNVLLLGYMLPPT